MMKGILSFSQIQSLLFRPFQTRTGRILVHKVLERLHWLLQYQEKRILFYWVPSHVGIRGIEKTETAAKAGILRRVTNVLIPFGDFKNHINVPMKLRWQ